MHRNLLTLILMALYFSLQQRARRKRSRPQLIAVKHFPKAVNIRVLYHPGLENIKAECFSKTRITIVMYSSQVHKSVNCSPPIQHACPTASTIELTWILDYGHPGRRSPPPPSSSKNNVKHHGKFRFFQRLPFKLNEWALIPWEKSRKTLTSD